MIVVQTIFTRPSPDVPWYHESWTDEMKSYILDNYAGAGKLDGSFFENFDRTQITFIHVFVSKEIKEEWDKDHYLNAFRKDRAKYNKKKKITCVIEDQE